MAAKFFRKDKYATWRVIYDKEKSKTTEKAGIIFQEMDKAKKDQDNGVTLGSLGRIHYKRYGHDVEPLALFMSYTNNNIRCYVAVNMHYLITSHALLLIKKIKQQNNANIKQGRSLIITYDMIKGLGLPILAYRNYKYQWTKPISYIPREEWEEVIKAERSVWQGKFYGQDQAAIDKTKKTKRTKAKKRKKKRNKRR